MPTIKLTKAVVGKLVHLCNTYASGALGDRFSWQDLENVCGMPYQTLCKNPQIKEAYSAAKQALQKMRGAQTAVNPARRMETTELEQKCLLLEAQNAALQEKLKQYELRFVTYAHNVAAMGFNPERLEDPTPESVKHDARKRNNIKIAK
jgi:hypothetical protein